MISFARKERERFKIEMKQFISIRKAVLLLVVIAIFMLTKNYGKPSAAKRDTVAMPPFNWKGQTVEGCDLDICEADQRSDLMADRCKGHPMIFKGFKPHDPSSYYRFIYDDKHKVIFCASTKTLTTSFYRMFYEAVTGKRLDYVHCRKCWYDQELGWLDRLPIKEIEKRVEEYYKVMLVRHPLDRLKTSWKRGLVAHDESGPVMKEIGRKIVKRYRDVDAASLDEEVNEGVEFEEFLRYVADVEEDEDSVHHRAWMPMHHMCHPCALKYDFVAKMETIHEDAKHILQMVNMTREDSHLQELIHTRSKSVHTNLRKRLHEFDSVDPDVLDRIVELYKWDFELLDYHWDGETAACGHCTGDPSGRCC